MPFDTGFQYLNDIPFIFNTKSAPIPGNQGSFQILQLFNTSRYQSLVILSFSFVVILI